MVCLATVMLATWRTPGAWLARYEGGSGQFCRDIRVLIGDDALSGAAETGFVPGTTWQDGWA